MNTQQIYNKLQELTSVYGKHQDSDKEQIRKYSELLTGKINNEEGFAQALKQCALYCERFPSIKQILDFYQNKPSNDSRVREQQDREYREAAEREWKQASEWLAEYVQKHGKEKIDYSIKLFLDKVYGPSLSETMQLTGTDKTHWELLAVIEIHKAEGQVYKAIETCLKE